MTDTKKLLSGSSVLFIGSLIGSLFSYVYNMMMGRLLGPELYGELSTVLSLTMILSVVGVTLSLITVQSANELYHQGKGGALVQFVSRMNRYTSLVGFSLIVLLLALIKPLTNILSLTSLIPALLVAVSIFFSLLLTVNRSVLQGLHAFVTLSVSNIVEMVLRLGSGILLVLLGFSLNGAVMAIVLATGLAYLLSFVSVAARMKKVASGGGEDTRLPANFFKDLLKGPVVPTFCATLLLIVLLNADIILMRMFFDNRTAGLYAAVSTVGKIILYLTTPIISAMFPLISEKRTKGEKHYQTFLFAIALTLVAALGLLAVYMVVPGLVMKTLYGAAYTELYYLLPQVGLFILIYSLVNLVVNYNIIIRDYFFLAVLLFVLGLAYVLVLTHHDTVEEVVRMLVLSTGIGFTLVMARYFYSKRAQVAQLISGDYE